MQLLPDWFYTFVPPEWWPDRPRAPYFHTLNLLPIAGGASETIEAVFDKRRDVLIFGGCVAVTNTAGTAFDCPITGTFTSILARITNPAGNVSYTGGNTQPAVGASNQAGFVPLESIFSVGQHMAQRSAYWPIPIPVPKGGSLQLDLINMNGAATKNIRFTFWAALVYDEKEFAA